MATTTSENDPHLVAYQEIEVFIWLRNLLAPKHDETVIKEFFSSVAGVSHKNGDGTFRQKIIGHGVYAGMPLTLRLEDDNPYDRNAIALLTNAGEQVGYLNARLASDVRDWLGCGERVSVTVKEVTGGTPDKPTRGVNILVTVAAVSLDE